MAGSARDVSKWAEVRRKDGAELDLVASWVSSGSGLERCLKCATPGVVAGDDWKKREGDG
jgi:hypothetical protein